MHAPSITHILRIRHIHTHAHTHAPPHTTHSHIHLARTHTHTHTHTVCERPSSNTYDLHTQRSLQHACAPLQYLLRHAPLVPGACICVHICMFPNPHNMRTGITSGSNVYAYTPREIIRNGCCFSNFYSTHAMYCVRQH